jgi:hypothetical protein
MSRKDLAPNKGNKMDISLLDTDKYSYTFALAIAGEDSCVDELLEAGFTREQLTEASGVQF